MFVAPCSEVFLETFKINSKGNYIKKLDLFLNVLFFCPFVKPAVVLQECCV